jgi:WD40 repeat protein
MRSLPVPGSREGGNMTSVFISYSRKDKTAAEKLTEKLKRENLDFWIDWTGIDPATDFWIEIEKGIEQADNFLFLLSPASVKSNVCGAEIEYAIQNGKRLIPVVVRNVKQTNVHEKMQKLNWIFFRDQEELKTNFTSLITAIYTDQPWVQFQRRLLVRAKDWERADHENSLLLRGKDLQDAESQLALNALKEPQPTPLQREYVLRSRQVSDRQRRIVTGIAIAGLTALALLAAFGLWQANVATENANVAVSNASTAQSASTMAVAQEEIAQVNADTAATAQAQAEEEARISRANQHAALAQAKAQRQLDLSILLSLEAYREEKNFYTRGALWDIVRASPQLQNFLNGHTDDVYAVAFSPEGHLIASAGADQTIILWDAKTGSPIGDPLVGHVGYITEIVFSPDGKSLASASADFSIILWDVETHAPIEVLVPGHNQPIQAIAFSPDGKYLASGGEDGAIILRDMVAKHFSHYWTLGENVIVWSVAFSQDGSMLASGSSDSRIMLWDLQTAQQIDGSFQGHSSEVFSLAFSPDRKTLASGSRDRTIRIWDLASGEQIGQPLVGHASYVNSIAFSSDGSRLASGSGDTDVILWDVATHQPIGEPFEGHSDWVKSVAFSPDGKTLASGSQDRSVIVWNVERRPLISQILEGHSDLVLSVAFSPDGKTIASGSRSRDNAVILWDVERDEDWDVAVGKVSKQVLTGEHRDGVYTVAFSQDGKMLASGSYDKTIILWDVQTGRPIGKPLAGHSGTVTSLAFSPDRKILASGSDDALIILWDIETGRPIDEPLEGHSAWISSLAFRPDGTQLASASGDFTARLWDVEGHRPLEEPIAGLFGLAFNPDGTLLAVGNSDSDIVLYETETYTPIGQPFEGHTSFINSIAFSPSDGRLFASVANDNKVILWDVETHQPMGQPLEEHTDFVKGVAFNPDGTLMATGSNDTTVILWDVSIASWIHKLCERVGRNFTPVEWLQYFPDREYDATCRTLPKHPSVYRQLAEAMLIDGERSRLPEEALASLERQMGLDPAIEDPAGESAKLVGDLVLLEIFEEADNGRWQEVLALIDQAKKNRLPLDRLLNNLYYLNVLCRYGGLNGYAIEVLDYCERAVDLAPTLAYIRDSRGLVHALTGDSAAAIEDFQFYIESYPAQTAVQQRQQWIIDLRAGINPFTPAVLSQLRNQ